MEIIEREDAGRKEFSFISNGDINEGEMIVIGSNHLFDELSKSDLRETILMESAESVIKNIESILGGENIDKNIGFFVMKNDYFMAPKEPTSL